MSVDTIIVNFRTPDLTLKAVESVLHDPLTRSVIVVENGSGDNSAQILASKLTSPKIKLIISEKNLGFGGGNNLGAASATSKFIFLLNSDAYLSHGGLAPLVEAIKPQVGIAAPFVFQPRDGAQVLQDRNFGLFPTPARLLTGKLQSWTPETAAEWVSGVAFMMRRSDFLGLGGFDERIFMYLEDVDLCKRIVDQGKQIVRVAHTEVVHLGGSSAVSSATQKRQFRESTDYYLQKHGFGAAGRQAVKTVRAVRAKLRG